MIKKGDPVGINATRRRRQRPSIDQVTGTTMAERQRIRKRHKDEKTRAKRGIRSMVASDAYRDNYDSVFRNKTEAQQFMGGPCYDCLEDCNGCDFNEEEG